MTTVPAADGSPYQDYVLSAVGRSLFPVVLALRQWGEDQFFEPGEAHSRLLEKSGGKPVPRLRVLGSAGQPLAPEETVVRKVRSVALLSVVRPGKSRAGR